MILLNMVVERLYTLFKMINLEAFSNLWVDDVISRLEGSSRVYS